jgi:hypothetical protein
MRYENERWTDFSCDDAVTLYTQYSTQWDALSHVGQAFDADQDGEEELVYYNGYRGGVDILGPDDPKGPGALNLGIEKMAETCVQGRGVMADLFSRFIRCSMDRTSACSNGSKTAEFRCSSLTISPSKPFRKRARKILRDSPGFRSTDAAWSSWAFISASCGN